MQAVLFDFQGTVATTEDPAEWATEAAAACGVTLTPHRAAALGAQLSTAGRIGGPRPTTIPAHLTSVWANRDLAPSAHRAAYTGLAAAVPSGIDGFAEALYDRVTHASGWRAYADAVPTLSALRQAGVPIGVVSNVAFDIRPVCDALGFGQHVTAWTLSFEVGAIKPDPAVFRHACGALGVAPRDTLMVGDTPADAGAVDIGCRALILPAASPGAANGLHAVLKLAIGAV
jgi:HAD superfamily hydrolase (TIGR01509 family)